jgi:hypothetical protein
VLRRIIGADGHVLQEDNNPSIARRDIPRGRRKKKVKGMSGGGGSWGTLAAILKAISRLHPGLRVLAVIAAICGVIGLALGVLGWMKPATETATSTGEASQSMAFSYSAEVPRTAAYDGTTVYSPDPIFRKLANVVDLHMNYQGEPGRISVKARLSSQNGWHKTVELSQPRQFTTDRYTGKVQLDLALLERLAIDAGKAIGVDMGTITLAITAQVQHADGRAFAPQVSFNLAPQQLVPAGDLTTRKVNQATTGATESVHDRQIGAFGYNVVTAAQARKYAVLLLLAALISAGVIAAMALSRAPLKTRVQIQRRYPHLIVPVEPMASPPGKPVVIVESFPALVKLAEKYGQMVLTWTRPDGSDDFVVRDEGITYRYRITAQATAADKPPTTAEHQPTDGSHPGEATPVAEPFPVSEFPLDAEATRTAGDRPDGEVAAAESPEAVAEPPKRAAPRKRTTKTAAAKTATSRTTAAKAAKTATSAGTPAGRTPTKRARPAAKLATAEVGPRPDVTPETDHPTAPVLGEQVSAAIWANTTPEEPTPASPSAEPTTTLDLADTADGTESATAPGQAGNPVPPEQVEISHTADLTATASSETTEQTQDVEVADRPAFASPTEMSGEGANADPTEQAESSDAPKIADFTIHPEDAEPAETDLERKTEPNPAPSEGSDNDLTPTADAKAITGPKSIAGEETGPNPDAPLSQVEITASPETATEEAPAAESKRRADSDDRREPQQPARNNKRSGRRNPRRKKALASEPLSSPEATPDLSEHEDLAPAVHEIPQHPADRGEPIHDATRIPADRDDPVPAFAERKAMRDLAERNEPIATADSNREPFYDFLPPEKRPGAGPDEEEEDVDLEARRP